MHQLAVERTGRTTVGTNRLDMETIAKFIGAIIDDETIENPRPDLQRGEMLKLVCDDLLAFYTASAAIPAQPATPGRQGAK